MDGKLYVVYDLLGNEFKTTGAFAYPTRSAIFFHCKHSITADGHFVRSGTEITGSDI